jgi:hypothetical protein
MNRSKIFHDIKTELTRRDSKYRYNELVDLCLKIGVSKQLIVKIMTDECLICRATTYSLLNHQLKNIPKPVEQKLIDILRTAINESLTIIKHYRTFLKYQTIDNQIEYIKESKLYLANYDADVPFEIIAEEQNIDYVTEKKQNNNEYLNFIF